MKSALQLPVVRTDSWISSGTAAASVTNTSFSGLSGIETTSHTNNHNNNNHSAITMTGIGTNSNSSNHQNGMPPPLTEIVATPEEDRKTHIEVCVRVRPLVISAESSTSFLSSGGGQQSSRSNNNNHKAPSTTTLSGIPRPGSKLGSPPRHRQQFQQLRGTPPRNALVSKQQQNPSPQPLQLQHPNHAQPSVESMLEPSSSSSPSSPAAAGSYAWNVSSENTVTLAPDISNIPGRTDSYTLDHAYGPDHTTQDVYNQSVQSLVLAAMDGYHASVLAYGQTSTGKTHTMTGTAQQPGLIPLAIRECFDYLKRLSQPREYLLRLSYMEVYKEHIRDLLAPHHSAQPAPIRLFETAADGLVIKGLKEEVVTSPEQVFAILAEGESRRQVGATTLNAHSSRSHVIVRLWVESRAVSGDGNGGGMQRHTSTSSTTSSLASSSRLGGNVRVSSLSLVDLAGSESVRLTGSNERRQEGHYINQSLMTLGKVVYALSEMGDGTNKKSSKTTHIPYRDSKLTRLLQPSLSGNAQVVMVCCISPLGQHAEESHNTFKFAIRAKKIPQKATIQEAPDERTLLQSYRDEIEELKAQLKEAQEAANKTTRLSLSSASKTAAAASRSPGALAPSSSLTEDVVSEDEIQELVSSIQTMEKLILKSKPNTSPHIHQRPEDLIDAISDDEEDDDEEDLIALATTKSEGGTSVTVSASTQQSLQTPVRPLPAAPQDETDRNLEIELARIQGLLGSVLKKRKQQSFHKSSSTVSNNGGVSSSLTASTNSAVSSDQEEVMHLRAQLEQQELATTIRKADSSFLQKQLDEKDDLLLEVSKILEAVEQRQAQLDQENATLRQQVARLQFRLGDRPDFELNDEDRDLLRKPQILQQDINNDMGHDTAT